MKAKIIHASNRQKGAALAIGLIFLLLATIVTVVGMRGSNLQERMTSNTNHKALSFMAAEAGISEVAESLRLAFEGNTPDLEAEDIQNRIDDFIGEEFTLDSSTPTISLKYQVTDSQEDSSGNIIIIVQGMSEVGSNGQRQVAGRTNIEAVIARVATTSSGPGGGGGGAGIISERSILMTGGPQIYGSIHTNENFVARGDGLLQDIGDIESFISAGGTASFEGSNVDPERVLSNQSRVSIPRAIDIIACRRNDPTQSVSYDSTSPRYDNFEDFCKKTGFEFNTSPIPLPNDQNIRNQGTVFDCIPPADDLEGKEYYCEGSLLVTNDIVNGTFLVTGDILVRGSSDLGASGGLSVAFYSGGSITFNGSRDSAAVFWSDGEFIQRGQSTVTGLIRAGGDVSVETEYDVEFRGNPIYTQIDLLEDFISLPEIEQQGFQVRITSLRETGSSSLTDG